MNGIKVIYFSGEKKNCGLLTTEHAASSHGIPIFITESGEARGPAEVEDLLIVGREGVPAHCTEDAAGYCDASKFYEICKQAGFRFQTA